MMRCFSAGAAERFGRISLLKFPSHKIVAMAVCMLSAATTAHAGAIFFDFTDAALALGCNSPRDWRA